MATAFLWLNLIMFGYLSASNIIYAKAGGFLTLRRVLVHIATWQAVASLVVLSSGASPWHLLWTFPASATVAFICDQRTTPDGLLIASAELPLESRKWFVEFGLSHPALRAFFAKAELPEQLLRSTRGETRKLAISHKLSSLSEKFYQSSNFRETLQTLHWALRFDPLNYAAWVALAETHVVMEDKCAARWASKCLFWRPNDTTSKLAVDAWDEVMSDEMISGEGAQRMQQIISICNDNPDWSDSADLLMPFGL